MSNQSTDAIRTTPLHKKDFSFFEAVTLRWADNDAYGHINNAHYYSFFDTAVDAFLLHHNLRPYISGVYQTLVVASECRYFSQVSAPGTIQVECVLVVLVAARSHTKSLFLQMTLIRLQHKASLCTFAWISNRNVPRHCLSHSVMRSTD